MLSPGLGLAPRLSFGPSASEFPADAGLLCYERHKSRDTVVSGILILSM